MIHELKIHSSFFAEIVKLNKRFEVRKNDRDFQVGDFLALNEIDEGEYTGRTALVRVTYILDDCNFCKPGTVIMSIGPCVIRDDSKRDLFVRGEGAGMQVLDRIAE